MRITSLGHAALFVEAGDQRIFVDPVFADDVLSGALRYAPARAVDRGALPTPTAVLVTHGHFDHFRIDAMLCFPRDTLVLTPEDDLLDVLREAGFAKLRSIAPWEEISLGSMKLCPTPSDHGEPECGAVFSDADGVFWHMADGEVTPRIAHRLRAKFGHVDVVAAKYQPVVRASMGHLRACGAQFDKEEVLGWLEAAALCEPKLVFPFASGLAFDGPHAWFNRYAFPLSPRDVTSVLGERLRGIGRAEIISPGDVIEVTSGEPPVVQSQSSPFVKRVSSIDPTWEPVDKATLHGLDTDTLRTALATETLSALRGRFLDWIRDEVASEDSLWSALRHNRVVWQLVVHAGDNERQSFHIDFREPTILCALGEHPDANSFTHLGGATLLSVLRGEAPPILFWLAGQARSFDKVFFVENHRIQCPTQHAAPQQQLGDPFTFYLKHAKSDRIPRLHLVHDERKTTSRKPDLATELYEAIAKGQSRMLSMLGKLALAEAERLGIAIDTESVREASDAFRRHFGLLEEDDLSAWWKEASLDADSYTELMSQAAAATAIATRLDTMLGSEIARALDKHLAARR